MNLPSAVIGVQCRLSSSRLPCKALLQLADTTILGMCLERARNSRYPVFLLTSDQQDDDLIVESASRHGVDGVIRGSLSDVRSRYLTLARQTDCDYIVRVTADNPLTEFCFVDPLMQYILLHGLSYAWVEPCLCPEGTNIEIFSKQALLESIASVSSNENLEHVTPFMRRNFPSGQCLEKTAAQFFPFDCRRLSFTVDTLPDYARLARLINSVIQRYDIDWRSLRFVQLCAEFASKSTFFSGCERNHLL